jgi:hypothetical protein
MKRPYSEGSVFLVPLGGGGFARGIVARVPLRAGKILLGYFFGPKVHAISDVMYDDLEPKQAILCVRFGDLGLINGTWSVLGILPSWQRANWPFPDFVRRELLTNRAYLVHYVDTDPRKIEFEKPIDPSCDLSTDGLCGSGWVELRLTKLLAPKSA